MRIPPDFTLRTPRLLLRAFAPQDAQRVFEIRSDFGVTRMLVFPTYPPVLEQVNSWLREYADEWQTGTAYRFAVVADGRLIGSAEVDEIQDGCGELGYWFERDHWGRGLASEAAGAVHDFATQTLGLRRLVAGHAADNPASGRILLRLGFRHVADRSRLYHSRGAEAVRREYVFDVS